MRGKGLISELSRVSEPKRGDRSERTTLLLIRLAARATFPSRGRLYRAQQKAAPSLRSGRQKPWYHLNFRRRADARPFCNGKDPSRLVGDRSARCSKGIFRSRRDRLSPPGGSLHTEKDRTCPCHRIISRIVYPKIPRLSTFLRHFSVYGPPGACSRCLPSDDLRLSTRPLQCDRAAEPGNPPTDAGGRDVP